MKLKDVLEKEIFEKYILSDKMVDRLKTAERAGEFTDADKKDISNCVIAGYHKLPTDGEYLVVKSSLEKYYLSQKMLDGFAKHNEHHEEKGTGFIFSPKDEEDIANCLRANASICATDNTLKVDVSEKSAEDLKIGDYRTDEGFRWRDDGNSPCIMASMRDKWNDKFTAQNPPVVMVSREVRTEESKKKRKKTGTNDFRGKEIEFREQDVSNTITTALTNDHLLKIKPDYNIKRLNETVKKHHFPKGEVRFVDSYNQSIHENSACISTRINDSHDKHLWDGYKIRRLTPRECFRLMDFPETFDFSCVSDSQAYKQAGNSIVVRVLEKILEKLPL
jgi:hypothetical protein